MRFTTALALLFVASVAFAEQIPTPVERIPTPVERSHSPSYGFQQAKSIETGKPLIVLVDAHREVPDGFLVAKVPSLPGYDRGDVVMAVCEDGKSWFYKKIAPSEEIVKPKKVMVCNGDRCVPTYFPPTTVGANQWCPNGQCTNGQCSLPASVACPNGQCINGQCLGIDMNVACPNGQCANGMCTIPAQQFTSTGYCSTCPNGQCQTGQCVQGCENGQCIQVQSQPTMIRRGLFGRTMKMTAGNCANGQCNR